jgi:hypothetical protein
MAESETLVRHPERSICESSRAKHLLIITNETLVNHRKGLLTTEKETLVNHRERNILLIIENETLVNHRERNTC